MTRNNHNGFTLVEIAIVVLIVSILLGYTIALFPRQQELKQYRQANQEIDEIINRLVGFAQINGRLPCPDTNGDVNLTTILGIIDGLEDNDNLIDNSTGGLPVDTLPDACKAYFGFLPRATIGINGNFDALGRLLDPWGQPYLYHVSNVNADSDGDAATAAAIDLVSPNGIREEGMSSVAGATDLHVCTDSNAVGDDLDCTDVSGVSVLERVAAVIISTGKDVGQVASAIQNENIDGLHDGTTDKVYVKSTLSDVTNEEYDDVVKWISTNRLFSKMIEADQLP